MRSLAIIPDGFDIAATHAGRVLMVVVLLAMSVAFLRLWGAALLTQLFHPEFRRPRGNSRYYPDPVWVRDEDVLCWGDPRGRVVHGLPDGRGGVYSVNMKPAAAERTLAVYPTLCHG